MRKKIILTALLLTLVLTNTAMAMSIDIAGTVNSQMASDGLKPNVSMKHLRNNAQKTLNVNACKSKAFNLFSIAYIPVAGGNINIIVKYYGKGGTIPTQTVTFSSVAGVADNGYVSCPSGKWLTSGQCSIYDWSFNEGIRVIKQNFITQSNNSISAGQPVTASGSNPVNSNTGQAGLECINNSCPVNGQVLSAQTAANTPAVVNRILDQLAGGISGAFSSAESSSGSVEPGNYRTDTANRMITISAITTDTSSNCSNATSPVSACPAGYAYQKNINRNGICVSPSKATVSPTCPPQYAESNGQCVGTGSPNANTVNKLKNLFNQGGNSLTSESAGYTRAGNDYLNSENLPSMNTMTGIAERTTGTVSAGSCSIVNNIKIKDIKVYKPVFTNSGSICIGSDNGSNNCYPMYSSTFISWSPNYITLGSGSSNGSVVGAGTVSINANGNWSVSGGNCAVFNSSSWCFSVDKANPHQLNASGGCTGYIKFSAKRGFIGAITCNGGSDNGSNSPTNNNNIIAFNAIATHQYTPYFSNVKDSCIQYEKKGQNNCQTSQTDCCSLQSKEVYPYNTDGAGLYLYKNGRPTNIMINRSVYPLYILPNYNQNTKSTDNFSFDNTGTAITASVSPMGKGDIIINPVSTAGAPALTEYPSSPDAKTGLEFWNISESWTCTGGKAYNFNKLNDNLTPITKTVTGSSTRLSYKGNPSSTYKGMRFGQTNVTLNTSTNIPILEYCVIKKTQINNNVNNTQNGQVTSVANATKATIVKTKTVKCNSVSGKWDCPISSGYTVKTNCTGAANLNANKFPTAITDLTIMTEAAKSMVCK